MNVGSGRDDEGSSSEEDSDEEMVADTQEREHVEPSAVAEKNPIEIRFFSCSCRKKTRSKSGKPTWRRGGSREERWEPKKPTTRAKGVAQQERTLTIQDMVSSAREGQRQGGPA